MSSVTSSIPRYGVVQMEPRLVEIQASVLSQNLEEQEEIMRHRLPEASKSSHQNSHTPTAAPSYKLSQQEDISKHYALNNQILNVFDSLYEQNQSKLAYAVGMRFVETALVEIPKHGYYYTKEHLQERLTSCQEAVRVTELLQNVVLQEEEEEKTLRAMARLACKRASEARRQQQEQRGVCDALFCGSLLEYSDTVSEVLCPSDKQYKEEREQEEKQQYYEPIPFKRITTSELELERALFLSGLQLTPTPSSSEISISNSPSPKQTLKEEKEVEDIYTLSKIRHAEFRRLVDAARIRVSRIDTHQGRLVGSINGCTVIAPLLCIHHFGYPDGLPDVAIVEIIDVITPVVLPQVRDKLGLTKDALIIPADVHDYLIESQLLSQAQFVTVMGGNILNEQHMSAFVEALAVQETKRLAATLFFQEHVVAILKLPRGNGVVWFDLIDSLPYEETLSKTPFQDDADSSCSEQREGPESLSGDNSFDIMQRFSLEENDYVPNAARIRCLDKSSLKATLQWYACSKFSQENKSYIDSYPWDDMNSDFDPRVFQAFVWAEA